MYRRIAALVSLILLPFLALTTTVQAAPQVLGLIASAEPMPLNCAGGECATDASAFCLQKWRASPAAGYQYTAAGGEGIRLVALTQDGKRVVVPNPEIKVVAQRGHSAVRLSVSVDWMQERGYASAAIEIGRSMSLVPLAFANDPKPQTERDIRVALTTLREIGNKLVDDAGPKLALAQLVNRIANVLPPRGRAKESERDAAWSRGTKDLRQASQKIIAGARKTFKGCYEVTRGGYVSLRQCLSSKHDIMVGKLNRRYWQATDIGM